jgi:hypothetical protein
LGNNAFFLKFNQKKLRPSKNKLKMLALAELEAINKKTKKR